VTATIELLRRAGILSPLAHRFAETVGRIAGETGDEALTAAALVASRVGDAHVCLELARLAGAEPRATDGSAALAGATFPALDRWLDLLGKSPLVRDADSPLCLDGSRLYLRRYHEHETAVARQILARVAAPAGDVDRALLAGGLRRLFPDAAAGAPDWQRIAAAIACLRRFAVIAGGPGTGKTWTVTRVLALLIEQRLRKGGPALRVHLMAPTGKAAARLRETIRESRARIECPDDVRKAIPDDASTIHRALGASEAGTFRYDASRRLVTDLVVVDEASMVDLPLMSRLLAAIPERARLVLLGDRDQLASVEAGSVLADICGDDGGGRTSRFSAEAAAELRELTGDEVPPAGGSTPPIRDAIVYLQKSHRFEDREGIRRLAGAVQRGDAAEALEVLRSDRFPEVSLGGGSISPAIEEAIVQGYGEYAGATEPARALEALGKFRVLCAHRRGPDGAEAVNRLIERLLADGRLLRAVGPSYHRRPILVTRNDAATRLYNGDVGFVERAPDGSGRAIFPALDDDPGPDGTRRISLSRLPPVETAFAITVHKSQGSEFDHVLVVLPEKESPVVTRELLYTALTRARRGVLLVGTDDVIRKGVETPTERGSGLGERLSQ
jgi:exodeoxyribonuclease V alpha subunit